LVVKRYQVYSGREGRRLYEINKAQPEPESMVAAAWLPGAGVLRRISALLAAAPSLLVAVLKVD
jgi:hypothetical protein